MAEEYHSRSIDATLARMETKIDNHTDDLRGVSENIAELYNRVGGLEKWKWWVMGIAVGLVFLLSQSKNLMELF